MIFNSRKIIFSIIFLTTMNVAVAMEKQESSLSSSSSSSGSFTLSESLMYYAPTKEGLSEGLSNAYNTMAAYSPTREGMYNAYNSAYNTMGSIIEKGILPAANSVYTTASIKLDDNKALIKLGYPTTNPEAQKELDKSLDSYIEYYTLGKKLSKAEENYNNSITRQKYNILQGLIGRRKEIVERIAPTLQYRLDGLNVANHLLQYHNHSGVMTDPIKNIISLFVLTQQKAEKEAKEKFSEKLNKLLETQQPEKEKEEK